nr:hypothetical protein [Mangrovicoccus ximenensis]
MNLFSEVKDLVLTQLDALAAEGKLPDGLDTKTTGWPSTTTPPASPRPRPPS